MKLIFLYLRHIIMPINSPDIYNISDVFTVLDSVNKLLRIVLNLSFCPESLDIVPYCVNTPYNTNTHL